ncbi:Wzz/FepE/Etk N-terminal domain-containing protein [Pedobacter sp. ASV1-7]|uniref:Wzz/FepE/Etk N-terminal domain-containing protein n=1 Tax=Pedobacter sp. ASV1-7 TaxID=3145237 RepID=UPI0032E8F116
MSVDKKQYISEEEQDEISLRDIALKLKKLFNYLAGKWLIITIFCIIGAVIGYMYATWKKPVYTASTTFVIENGEGRGGMGQYAGLASMVGLDIGSSGGGIFQGDNILELYKSRTMIENTLLTAVDDNGKPKLLLNRFIEFNGLKDSWKGTIYEGVTFDLHSKDSTLTRLQNSILTTIIADINKNYLVVDKADKMSSIIKVDIKAKDEFFAKEFNDQIVKSVNDFYIQTKTKKSIENIKILTLKTDSVRSVMNGAIYSAAKIADATPNLNPTREVQRAAPIQRSQFNAETNRTILGELVKNLEMSKMGLLKESPLIQVIDQPVYPLNVTALSTIKGALMGALLMGFIIIMILISKRIFNNILI